MNTKTSLSVLAPNRCQYLTPTGRQCASSVAEAGASFCARHAVAQISDSVDFSGLLFKEGYSYQKAQEINHSLLALYKLLAQGRISPRRASVLAYIANLMLSSFKAIDYDNERFPHEPAQPAAPKVAQPPKPPVSAGIGPGTEPLPATAKEFLDEALSRKPN